MKARARAYAPASMANLGAGFDSFGLAIDVGGDEVEVSQVDSGIHIEIHGLGSESIPVDPEQNTAGRALRSLVPDRGVRVRLRKGVPPASGLGSSAASAVAAVLAADALFDLRLSPQELIHHAAQGEIAAAGAAHRDNVAASLSGGLTIAAGGGVHRMAPPYHLAFAIAIAGQKRSTAESRKLLPGHVPLQVMSESLANAAAFVHALWRGDIEEAARCAERSFVDQARRPLIPDFDRIRASAMDAGASGVVIAGAGPAIAAFIDDRKARPEFVARAMGPRAFVARPSGGAYVQS